MSPAFPRIAGAEVTVKLLVPEQGRRPLPAEGPAGGPGCLAGVSWRGQEAGRRRKENGWQCLPPAMEVKTLENGTQKLSAQVFSACAVTWRSVTCA